MRRPEPSPLLILLAAFGISAALVPVACAGTSAIESMGTGGAGSTGTSFVTTSTTVSAVAGTGSSGMTCGIGNSNMACEQCLVASCCSEAQFCAMDPRCVACVGSPSPPASCQTEGSYTALYACLDQACADRCGLPSPPTGGGGAGGTSAGPGATVSSTGSFVTVGSTGAGFGGSNPSGGLGGGFATVSSGGLGGGFATVSSGGPGQTVGSSGTFATGSTSGGGGGGGDGAGGAGGSSSGGLYTCSDVDNGVGCCDPSGMLWFCDIDDQLYEGTCPHGTVCGWAADPGYYDCVPPPGGGDPSGTYPIACMGP
jgi:hypothetical protein